MASSSSICLSLSSVCYEWELAVLRTAMTSRNAGKKFWGCPNYKNGEDEDVRCNYFEWAANDVDGRDLLISKLERKNQIEEFVALINLLVASMYNDDRGDILLDDIIDMAYR
ncbi:hypothetical protein Fmac_020291 [Flemingia macrophylla]|uniref:GRF-type domain-containing protein n=1 Tax=Flemingia macrophylla TaxID=520843 RepID=A0ABD1LTN1_9FABA